jgi:hypothetical protein
MVDQPTLTLQIALASTPLATSPTWTDVSDYVRAGSVRIGRSNELADFQAGVLSIDLDNRDRRFDPTYTSGPYYGQLTPRRQVKLTATYGAGTFQWVGFVRSWPVSPQIAGDNVCRLEAYDALSYLAQQDLPTDLYTYTVEANAYTASNCQGWFPLGTSDQYVADRCGGTAWTWTTSTPRTTDAPSPYMGGASSALDGTYGAIGPAIDATNAYTLSLFFRTDTAGPAGGLNPIVAGASATGAPIIGIDEYGRVAFRGPTGSCNSGFPGNDGNWHHVALKVTSAGTMSLYVDGYNLTTSATGDGFDGAGWQLLGISNATTDSPYYTGDVAHVTHWNVAQADSVLVQLANAGLRGTLSSTATTDQCVGAVLDAIGWPASWRAIETGTIMPGGMTWGTDALSMLQLLALTEGGRVFGDRSGYVAFHNGGHDYTDTRATTSQATFSDSGTAGVVPFSSVDELTYSEEYLANRVTVTTATDQAFLAEDTSSQTTYGVRARQLSTIMGSQLDAQTRADAIVNRYKEPQLRVNQWRCLPQRNAAVAFPEVLDLRLADRVTFELQPARVGNRISQALIVEAIQHDFTPDTWRTQFSGSPAVQAWLLEDATYGLLETSTVLA